MVKSFVIVISIVLLLTIPSNVHAQKVNYIIDNSIKSEVDKKTKLVEGSLVSSMDLKVFENDILITDTYSDGKSISDCAIMALFRNGTISIVGFKGLFLGFGYEISLSKDTCIVKYLVHSDTYIYKLKTTDDLNYTIAVPCTSYKLTLANKPTFNNDEVMEGKIELTSDEYFEVSNGSEKKYKVQLTGYFKTLPYNREKQ